MQQFNPGVLTLFSYSFGTHKRSVDECGEPVRDKLLPASTKDLGPKITSELLKDCENLDLPATSVSLRRLIRLYEDSESTIGDLQNQVKEVQSRLVDELNARYFLSLTLNEAKRFEDWRDGWEGIIARFGEVARDVEEMNKCFALSRYTASMFHALHVAEWGTIKLGDYIGVSDPKKGWAPTEKKLRELINAGHSALPTTLVGKFEFLEQMNREIDSMVLAWRHKVDHAANHLYIVPSTDFTPDIAEHIIGAVRIFMQRLLEGIPT